LGLFQRVWGEAAWQGLFVFVFLFIITASVPTAVYLARNRYHGTRTCVPKKIRELEAALQKAGFVYSPGKGSHRKWKHPSGAQFNMSGKSGDDAKRYQEKGVAEEIRNSEAKP
jgi:predicted RNA binding protein YcfA (HicA-like mRNA interferase family)